MATGKSAIEILNGQQFAQALKSIPTASILKTLVYEASVFTLKEVKKRPPKMGATPGTSGLHSTGNIPTPGRGYYVRGQGGRYATLSGKTHRTGKKSENLRDSWQTVRSGDSLTVTVESNVSYATRVQGGADNAKPQTRVMAARGWKNLDTISDMVRENFAKTLQATIVRQYLQWFAKHGVTATE